MIAFLEGTLAEKRAPGEIIVNVGGVGFLLSCSAQTLAAAPGSGGSMRVHTRMVVREDGMELFGFMTAEERAMFDLLRSVSGIGARTALAALSTLSVNDLNRAIALSDAAAIARAPGVGKKTAQRVILELKDKVAPASGGPGELDSAAAFTGASAENEAVAGLMSLGYSSSEAQRAVARAAEGSDASNTRADELILRALKRINA
ncbi:MAG: Holliday junction branch migration protein RuvA [Oscillospiraceae bacterium]|jgi:Holliday junction DNA helicase RuvA|nr:Holliday junction branch migration protein RuvA [Oscillospiraceae bacterium]